MDISKLRSRITIQRVVVQTDAIGNHANAWVDYWSCAAYANLASGKEYGAAGQTLGSDTLVFEVRWCERLLDLDGTRFRILFGGAVYNITCVDDVQFRHERLKLTATRVPAKSKDLVGGGRTAE